MIETLKDPLIISVLMCAAILLCVGWITLKQEEKKKKKKPSSAPATVEQTDRLHRIETDIAELKVAVRIGLALLLVLLAIELAPLLL